MKALRGLLASEPVWIVALVVGGLALLRRQAVTFDVAATASLVGALFGAAAILAGNWISPLHTKRQAAQDLDDQRAKLQTLIAAELVNVAVGLVGSKEFTDGAIVSARSGAALPSAIDLTLYHPRSMPFTTLYHPRSMPFTDSLGTAVLILEKDGRR